MKHVNVFYLQVSHYPGKEALLTPLYKWWNWGSKRWSHLLVVTQRGSITFQLCSQFADSRVEAWLHRLCVEDGKRRTVCRCLSLRGTHFLPPLSPPTRDRAPLSHRALDGYNSSFSTQSPLLAHGFQQFIFPGMCLSWASTCLKTLKCWCRDDTSVLLEERCLYPNRLGEDKSLGLETLFRHCMSLCGSQWSHL